MGMVNFLSMFCPELQKLLKLIYDLLRKGRQFFEEIKCRLIKPPILHMPNCVGRFHLYLDMSNLQQEAICIKYRMENQN